MDIQYFIIIIISSRNIKDFNTFSIGKMSFIFSMTLTNLSFSKAIGCLVPYSDLKISW